MAVTHHAAGIEQIRFGRAVHTEIQAQRSLPVCNIQTVGMAEFLQPMLGRRVLVLVMDAEDRTAFLGELF